MILFQQRVTQDSENRRVLAQHEDVDSTFHVDSVLLAAPGALVSSIFYEYEYVTCDAPLNPVVTLLVPQLTQQHLTAAADLQLSTTMERWNPSLGHRASTAVRRSSRNEFKPLNSWLPLAGKSAIIGDMKQGVNGARDQLQTTVRHTTSGSSVSWIFL